MKLIFDANIYLLLCSLIALIYGIAIIMSGRKPALYFRYAVFTVLSIVLSRIFYAVSVLCFNELPSGFNIGFVGYYSMFLFFCFSNARQIDMLADEGGHGLRYKGLSVIIPVLELISGVSALLWGNIRPPVRISYFVMTIPAGFAAYFNVKHLIVPDVELGLLRSIRGYNLLALSIELLSLAEVGLSCFSVTAPIIYVQGVLGVLYLLVLPVLYRGVKKWTI